MINKLKCMKEKSKWPIPLTAYKVLVEVLRWEVMSIPTNTHI
jgi:hypothetical protein